MIGEDLVFGDPRPMMDETEWPTPGNKPLEVAIVCKDPAFARSQGIGPVTVRFKDEPYIGPGPTSRRLAVVDYNQQLDVVFEPVQPKKDGTGFVVGRNTDFVENIKLRQAGVWAIVNRTIALVEDPRVLGRPIQWASNLGRLLVLPHAGPGQNAFYDRATGAIHFLYFEGHGGERVYTCLSHDIVTHELGHAILDGLKPYYNEVSSPETAAFHEYFGDALAITASLSFREVLAGTVGRARATKLDDVLGEIGAEFGSALGGRATFLRSAAVPRPLSKVRDRNEEHDLSEVLTSTFFEHLRRRYPVKLKSAVRDRSRGALDGGHAVTALINAASETSQLFLRALDYCPPVDVSFPQYALAVEKADRVAYPTSPEARDLARSIFAKRGIPVAPDITMRNRDLGAYDVDRLSATRADALRFLDARRRQLGIPPRANLRVQSLYRTKKSTIEGYWPPEEVVLELVWTEELPLEGRSFGAFSGTRVPLYCGGTLVFDRSGNVLHYVLSGDTPVRRRKLLDYLEYLVRDGRIGARELGFGGAAHHRHGIQARVNDGMLTLTRDASMRHANRRTA